MNHLRRGKKSIVKTMFRAILEKEENGVLKYLKTLRGLEKSEGVLFLKTCKILLNSLGKVNVQKHEIYAFR